MVTAIVAGVVLLLCLALVFAVARDPGPPPGEVAVAYELAWDRLDFETLWSLSGTELRDDRPKHDFVAAKRAAYDRAPGLAGLARDVVLEDVTAGADVAVARTRIEATDGSVVRNELHLARRDGTWLVVAYELRESSDARPGA
ncbi:MAG TPA: hypothetical protein VMQ81_07315 [Acidimicrobiia bacterium]|nr:hypothetical protein [Acidimicrobiia bacterium]